VLGVTIQNMVKLDELETQNFHTLDFRCLADIYKEKFNPFDLSVFSMKKNLLGRVLTKVQKH
jgi:hypothetical protein